MLVSHPSVAEGFPRLQWFCTRKQMVEGMTDLESRLPPVEETDVSNSLAQSLVRRGGPDPMAPLTPNVPVTHDSVFPEPPQQSVEGHSPNLWLASDSPPGFKAPSQLHLHFSAWMPPQTKLSFAALISPENAIFSLTRAVQTLPGAAVPAPRSPQTVPQPRAPRPACPCSEGYPEDRHEGWPEGAEPTERQGAG